MNNKKILLWWKTNEDKPKKGDKWFLNIRIKPPNGWQNKNTFDYETYLHSQNVSATGYVLDQEPNVRLEASSDLISNIRETLRDKQLDRALPEITGVLLSLTLGDRSLISQKHWDLFIQTGTNHLLAISGLHITLIAGLIFWLTRRRFGFKTSLIASLLFAGFYAAMAGFAIPTQRAWIMLFLFSVMLLSYRYWPIYFWLIFTAVLVLLIEPKQVLSVSFSLSFIAVMTLLWTSQKTQRFSFLNLLYLQWVLSLVMGIATLLFIGNISLISPVANLIIVPLYSFIIIPLALIDSAALYLTNHSIPFLELVLEKSINMSFNILKIMNNLEYGYIFLGQANFILGLIAISLLLLAFKKQKYRFMTFFLTTFLLYPKYNTLEFGTVRYTVLDVGQGQSLAVQTRHYTLIYDTGKKGRDTQVIKPFLLGEGRRAIDRMVISHDDNDHSGSADSLVKQMVVHKTHINQGCFDQWTWDGVEFELTRLNTYSNDNDASCILKVTPQNGASLLVTGDLSKQSEQKLIENQPIDLNADILIAPHHGSQTSSSAGFIQSVSPQAVIYSSGFKNRFNHPHPSIVQRYRELGVNSYSTRCSGMIQIDSDETGKIQFNEYRKEKIWPWYRQCGDSEL